MRCLFAGADGARGASVGTCAAVYTDVGIDAVDVALVDSAGGAFALASAAGYTVATDYVSHSDVS